MYMWTCGVAAWSLVEALAGGGTAAARDEKWDMGDRGAHAAAMHSKGTYFEQQAKATYPHMDMGRDLLTLNLSFEGFLLHFRRGSEGYSVLPSRQVHPHLCQLRRDSAAWVSAACQPQVPGVERSPRTQRPNSGRPLFARVLRYRGHVDELPRSRGAQVRLAGAEAFVGAALRPLPAPLLGPRGHINLARL